ncbi:MAG: hypothetical protein P9E24_05540 [Candidatus Competibacter sp.]|nr:hypothetical protein [Candidatus Competibacter sp.]MDG4585586.1 hypothetical protein [Candidatus Competibacter sp.]
MRHLFRGIRNLAIYLVPASLLAIAGFLLLALLYYPTPTVAPAVRPDGNPAAAEARWRAHADAMFAAMLIDALRQSRIERQTQGQTLMYRFDLDPPFREQPVTRLAPANGGALIRL